MKKTEKILLALKADRRLNDTHCTLNNCSPSQYMQGSNKILDDYIIYVENLINKK